MCEFIFSECYNKATTIIFRVKKCNIKKQFHKISSIDFILLISDEEIVLESVIFIYFIFFLKHDYFQKDGDDKKKYTYQGNRALIRK